MAIAFIFLQFAKTSFTSLSIVHLLIPVSFVNVFCKRSLFSIDPLPIKVCIFPWQCEDGGPCSSEGTFASISVEQRGGAAYTTCWDQVKADRRSKPFRHHCHYRCQSKVSSWAFHHEFCHQHTSPQDRMRCYRHKQWELETPWGVLAHNGSTIMTLCLTAEQRRCPRRIYMVEGRQWWQNKTKQKNLEQIIQVNLFMGTFARSH